MPSLHEVADNYFNSLNPIAKKIAKDIGRLKEQHGNWDQFPPAQRDQMLNEYIIDSFAKRIFTNIDCESSTDCSSFPKLKLQTGQKIVVDSENDNLTWRDEHSAPFSYATQAQLDFNISVTNQEKSPPKRKQTKHSEEKSEVDGGKASLRPIHNSPFLKGKLGHINTAYTCTGSEDESSQTDIFRTFGVTLTTGNNSSGSVQSVETDDCSDLTQPTQNTASQDALKSPFDIWKDFETESAKNNSGSATTKRKKSESEECLLGDFSSTSLSVEKEDDNTSADIETDLLSPAVLDITSDSSSVIPRPVSVVTEQPSSAWTELQDDLRSDSVTSDLTFQMDEEEYINSSVSVSKSGFDFLDDW